MCRHQFLDGNFGFSEKKERKNGASKCRAQICDEDGANCFDNLGLFHYSITVEASLSSSNEKLWQSLNQDKIESSEIFRLYRIFFLFITATHNFDRKLPLYRPGQS